MITIIIVIITCLTSYIAFTSVDHKNQFIFYPYAIHRDKEYHRFLSAGFIHADWMHLLFNMYVLYMFGGAVEEMYGVVFGKLGNLLYLLLYFGGMIMASLYDFFKYKDNALYRALGASGAVSAVVFSFIVFAPLAPLRFIFFPFFDIPAVVLGIAYLGYSYWAAQRGNDNIGHDAHFYGAIFGFLLTIALKPALAISFWGQIFGG